MQIKQIGSQIWFQIDGDTFIGNIDTSGDFSLEALHDDTPTVISGNYDGSVFTGFGYSESETVSSGAECQGTGTLEMLMGSEVSESTVFTSGVSWFESDSEQGSDGSYRLEFFSGTLIDDGSVETMSFYNDETETWETDTETETENYLTATGIDSADDRFIVNGYVDDVAGETAIIQPTDGGVAVDLEISHVDLMEIDLAGLPMLPFLDYGYSEAIAETDMFSTDAKGYIATITEQVSSYAFWCDDDWDDDWFNTDQNMACNNIVPIGSVEDGTDTDGSTDYDPVPASSFDQVISTPSELSAMGDATRSLGIWAGNGDSFQILAYLQTDDGTSTGANPSVIYVKDFWNGYQFKVGEGEFTAESVGSTAIIRWSIPETVRQLGDRDEGDHFIFVDQDTIDGELVDVLRRGEIWLEDQEEHEFLFNATAKAQILAAFELMPELPQAFLDASDNGVNFASDSTITLNETFGVAGFGLLREWEPESGGEVLEYYLFDSSINAGRYVFEVRDSSDSIIDSGDEAMTWSVNSEGNLDVLISSSSEEHTIALEDFSDTYRPKVVVLNGFEAFGYVHSERLVSQTDFEFEVANRVALASEPLDSTSFTFINNDVTSSAVEIMFFNSDGTWEWQVDSVQEDTATWSVDTTDNFITLDFGGDSDTIAIESIFPDSEDVDGDSDTTEDIYLFTGWYEVDATTGLGSFFRDSFFKN